MQSNEQFLSVDQGRGRTQVQVRGLVKQSGSVARYERWLIKELKGGALLRW